MCANCVSSIDSAAAAIGGLAGLRAWVGVHVNLPVIPVRKLASLATVAFVAVAVTTVALRHVA